MILDGTLRSCDTAPKRRRVGRAPGEVQARYHRHMTSDVSFDDVKRRIVEFGDRATLITVSADCRPHVVTVIIEVDGDRLVTRVGARTCANLADRPHLTLTWPPSGGDEYQLILDGRADRVGPEDHKVSEIAIEIERGILHRLAGLPTSGPSCLAL